jgi:hypothetical protein
MNQVFTLSATVTVRKGLLVRDDDGALTPGMLDGAGNIHDTLLPAELAV